MKSLLIVTESFDIGGLETHIRGEIVSLTHAGCAVHLATGQQFNDLFCPSETASITSNLALGPGATLPDLRQTVAELRRLIRRHAVECVHAHPFTSVIPSCLAAGLERIPFVLTLHGPGSVADYHGLHGPLYEFLLSSIVWPSANLVLAVSNEVADLASPFVSSELLWVLPNGVDTSVFTPPKRLKPADNRWLLISRLDPFKVVGIYDFVRKARGSGIPGILLVGDGPSKREFQDQIRREGLTEFVELVGSKANVASLIQSAAGVAGMGRVVLEGLACGKPVCLVGYDGVKGIVNASLLLKASQANFSGRNLENLSAETFLEQISNLSNLDTSSLAEVTRNKFSELALWAAFLDRLRGLGWRENALLNDIIRFCAASTLIDPAPFLQSNNLFDQIGQITHSPKHFQPALSANYLYHRSRFLDTRDREIDKLTQTLAEREEEIVGLNHTISERSSQLDVLSQQLKLAEETAKTIEGSISWRITKPFREARRATTSLKRKVTNAILSVRGHHAFTDEYDQKKRHRYYQKKLNKILKQHTGKSVILFCPVVDWNTPLFQRPQHIAKGLADMGFLFFYCTTSVFDSVDGFEQVHEGCYVTNQFELIDQLATRKIIHIYAADPKCTWEYIQRHKSAGDVILYEYIDEIHADIWGSEVAETLLDRHMKVLKTEDIVCVVSAEKLYRDVARVRTKHLELVTNGVEIEHFSISRNRADIPHEIKGIVEKNKTIVGYFGALAKWFDYELIISLARSHPEFEIMLIGWNYDQSLDQHPISDCPNISVIGPVDYKVLPRYACWFDVSTIPFLINEVTESTSPIKLFEYMALGHPIVTTDMPECRKYRSVLIGKDREEFISRVEEALDNKRKDENYLSILRSEAEENTWRSKAKSIADVLTDNMVGNPHWTKTISDEDPLLNAVQTEIVSCYRADKPDIEQYYERVYSKQERLYWFPVLKWIRTLSSLKRVADIGAAYGTLLLYAIKCHHHDHSLAIDAIGIMSPHLIRRYNITYINCDIERSILESLGTYDLILFTETLEHLNFHPVQTLAKLRQMLSNNGHIILTTPDAVEWGRVTTYYPSIDAIPQYTGQGAEWIDGHVWQYTREEAEMVIQAAGLEVVKFAYARGVSGRHLCFLVRPSSSSEKNNSPSV